MPRGDHDRSSSSTGLLAPFLGLGLMLASGEAWALPVAVDEQSSFQLPFELGGPEGLAFVPKADHPTCSNDPACDGVLYVSEGNTDATSRIFQFRLDGTQIGQPTTIPLGNTRGLDYVPTRGTILISSLHEPNFFTEIPTVAEIDLNGNLLTGPDDLNLDFTGLNIQQPESVFFHDLRGTLFLADEEGPNEVGEIFEIELDPMDATAFTVLGSFFVLGDQDLGGPFDDPSGIDFDPVGNVAGLGNIFMVDDSSGGPDPITGLRRSGVFIWDEDSALMPGPDDVGILIGQSTQILAEITEADTNCDPVEHCRDPEGVAFDPDSGILYILFEDSGVVGAFDVTVIPEPATVALLGLGLGGFAAARRVRRSASRS